MSARATAAAAPSPEADDTNAELGAGDRYMYTLNKKR